MQKYSIFIGIDISKKWFDAALCAQGKLSKMPHSKFSNNQKGYEKMLGWLQAQLSEQQLKGQALFCMEHTGIYALAICRFLEGNQQPYVLENPLRIKRSLGLRRGKSDKADAEAIAEYAWRFQEELKQRRPLPNELLLKMQALLSLRRRLVKYRHGLQIANHELEACVDQAISQVVSAPTAVVVKNINQQVRAVMKQVRQWIQADAELDRIYNLLTSVVGVGPVIASFLLVHTNGFTAFMNPRQFACHIGIAPFKQESGTSLDLPEQISQIANHQLKALLSNAATTAVQHDPQIKAFFKFLLEKGREPGWIYNAVKNKIVHRIFAVVKRGTPYVTLEH